MNQILTSSNLSTQPNQSPVLPTDIASSKSRYPRWLFWAIGGLAVVLILCAGIVVVGGIRLFQTSQGATEETLKVVDQFLQAGARKDVTTAFSLFSLTARDQTITQDGLAELFTTHEEYFTNYTSVKQDSFGINSRTNGVTATLQGAISYNGKPDRKFAATLTKEDGQWKLVGIRLLEEVGK